MMHKLHFETCEERPTDAIVPARGFKLFRSQPDMVLTLREVHVSGETPDRTGALKATALLLQDPSNFERMERTPIVHGKIERACEVHPAERFYVQVDNTSDTPARARVAVVGGYLMTLPGGRTHREDLILGLMPSPDVTKSRRFVVPPRAGISMTMSPPITCRPRKFTMRSNSELDLEVVEIRVSNVCVTGAEPVAVDLFHSGIELRSVAMTAANRMTIGVCNRGDHERYIEVEVDVERVEASAEKTSQESAPSGN